MWELVGVQLQLDGRADADRPGWVVTTSSAARPFRFRLRPRIRTWSYELIRYHVGQPRSPLPHRRYGRGAGQPVPIP